MTAAAERDDADAYLDENRNFKFAIYESVGSDVLLDLIERLWLQIGPFMRLYAKDVRFQLTIDQHESAIDALTQACRAPGVICVSVCHDDQLDVPKGDVVPGENSRNPTF